MIENEQAASQAPALPVNFTEYKKARAEGKPVTEVAPATESAADSEPAEKPAESADSGAATEKPIQDGQHPKRDRSAAGRAQELITAGRIEEAQKILDAAAKKDRDRADQLERELQEARTRKPEQAAAPAAETPKEPGTKSEQKALKAFLEEYFPANPQASYEDGLEAYYADKFNPEKIMGEFEKRMEEKRAKEAAEADAKKRQEAQQSAFNRGREKYDDFDEVLNRGKEATKDVPANPGVGAAIQESELVDDLVYHFSANPEEFRRVSALPPNAAYRAVIALEHQLSSSASAPALPTPGKPKIPPSAAPAPVAPLGGGSAGSNGRPKPSEAKSFADYKRARQG